MKTTTVIKTIVLALVGGLAGGGCAVQVRPPVVVATAPVAEVEVDSAPPPAQVDVEVASPGPDFVWIGGVWTWGPGGRWVWERGHWGRPPHPGMRWVAHHYEYRNGRHVFVRGGWR